MTTLDRLYKKGLLERRKDGRAFYYSPRQTSQEFSRNTTRRVIDKLIGSNEHGVEPVLACIVDAVSDRDRELLDELDRLIDEKRRTLPAKE
jgi:predicted transcriptional regulator